MYTSGMHSAQLHSNWAEIDVAAIGGNVRFVSTHTEALVMAVVKANGYGHGAVRVAQAALKAGASWCGVAQAQEALELRRAGVDCPILLLGLAPAARLAELISMRVSLTVWDPAQLEKAAAASRESGHPARLHLKVDTGMGRVGVLPQQAVALARRLVESEGLQFEGLLTHFARADEKEHGPTLQQERCFRDVIDSLEAGGLHPALIHSANSAATLVRPASHFDMVRVGIAMYGLHPSADCPCPMGIRPALAWKSQLTHVKSVPKGSGLSYGHEYITSGPETIGTVSAGYADGYRRVGGTVVLVAGERVPVVGRVCMDQFLVRLDGVPSAAVGDEVVLLGEQAQAQLPAEEMALRWGTNNYDVVCSIGARVPRIYV
jgi:alanine racemase